MADPEPSAPGAAADLESKEIWGDEADQLDEEIMKVSYSCAATDFSSASHSGLQPQGVRLYSTEGGVGSVLGLLFCLISIPKV